MDSMTDILLSNYITISMMVGLLIVMLFSRIIDKKTNMKFIRCVLMIFVIDITDLFDRYYAGLSYVSDARYLVKAIGYTFRPMVAAAMLSIVVRHRKHEFFLWIPVIINGVFAFSDYFNHWMFSYSLTNSFVRGPIGYMTHITAGLYTLLLIIMTIKKQKYVDMYEVVLIMYMALICFSAMYLEVKYKTRFLVPGSMMVSVFLYYMFFYVQSNKKDLLTGLLNRASFYHDADKFSSHSYALISMDMNCLKCVNDTKGHGAGDMALAGFSNTLLSCADKRIRIYRVGGDEFMAIGRHMTKDETIAFIESARKALSKTEYMCSFGFEIVDPHDDFDEACSRADAMMYEDKKRYKHR